MSVYRGLKLRDIDATNTIADAVHIAILFSRGVDYFFRRQVASQIRSALTAICSRAK